MINKETLKYIANLARLEIKENEVEKLSSQLSQILGYVEKLNGLDLTHIEPTAHAVQLENVFREDQVFQNQSINDTITQAPEHEEHFFRVPKVL